MIKKKKHKRKTHIKNKIPKWNSPQMSQNYFQFLVGSSQQKYSIWNAEKVLRSPDTTSSHNTERQRGSNSEDSNGEDSFCFFDFSVWFLGTLETASTLLIQFSSDVFVSLNAFTFSLLWEGKKSHPLAGAFLGHSGCEQET